MTPSRSSPSPASAGFAAELLTGGGGVGLEGGCTGVWLFAGAGAGFVAGTDRGTGVTGAGACAGFGGGLVNPAAGFGRGSGASPVRPCNSAYVFISATGA